MALRFAFVYPAGKRAPFQRQSLHRRKWVQFRLVRYTKAEKGMRRLLKRGFVWGLLAPLVVCIAGCTKKRIEVHPFSAPTVVMRSMEDVPPPQIDAMPEPLPPPELLIPALSTPPRPPRRIATQPAAPELEPEATESKPTAPRVAPRLSPAEADDLKEKTWMAINSAEKNRESVAGRPLTPAQQDLEGKVQAFLAQAREAIAAGDWVRASNLAEKALVLSRELLNSL